MTTHDTIIRVAHMLSQGPESARSIKAWLGLPMYAVNDALADLMRLGYAEPWGDCLPLLRDHGWAAARVGNEPRGPRLRVGMPTQSEINFIKMWLEHAVDGAIGPEVPVTFRTKDYLAWFAGAAEDGKGALRQSANGDFVLSPRGADLIATAKVVGLGNLIADDAPPKASEPNTVTCPTCEGRRRVPVDRLNGRPRGIVELVHGEPSAVVSLPGWDVACPGCGGDGGDGEDGEVARNEERPRLPAIDIKTDGFFKSEWECRPRDDEGWTKISADRTVLYAAAYAVPGVEYVTVYGNTATRSVEVVVDGGDDLSVAMAIGSALQYGVRTVGSEIFWVSPDGVDQREVRFSRPGKRVSGPDGSDNRQPTPGWSARDAASGWMLLADPEDIRHLAGKTVEAIESDRRARGKVVRASAGVLTVQQNGSKAHFYAEHGAKFRVVEDCETGWVTDPNEMRTLLAECARDGLLIDARNNGNEVVVSVVSVSDRSARLKGEHGCSFYAWFAGPSAQLTAVRRRP